MTFNGKCLSEPKKIAETFEDSFESCNSDHSIIDEENIPIILPFIDNLDSYHFSVNDVAKRMLKILIKHYVLMEYQLYSRRNATILLAIYCVVYFENHWI